MQGLSCSPGGPETTPVFVSFSSPFCPYHSLTGSIKRGHLVFNAAPATESIVEVTRHISIAFVKNP